MRAAESSAAAAVKGDARMAKVIAAAIGDRERPMPRDVVSCSTATCCACAGATPAASSSARTRRRGTHNERRPYVAGLVLDHFRREYRRALVRAYRADRARLDADAQLELPADRSAARVADPTVAAALARGEAAPPEWEDELSSRLRRQPEVRAALDRMWPVLSGTELVHDLFGFEALIRSASDGVLTDAEQRLLFRERVGDVTEVEWTEADLALVDEADSILGPPSAARPRARRRNRRDGELESARRTVDELGVGGFTTAADVLARYGSDAPTVGQATTSRARSVTCSSTRPRTSRAMQWRMLARRCPSGSMTLVGDFGQASRPGAAANWDDVIANLPVRVPPHRVTLTVNYRTPAEIMDVANRLLPAAAPGVEPARPVRSTGAHPEVVTVARRRAGGGGRRRGARRRPRRAAPWPSSRQWCCTPRIAEALADLGAVADDVEAIDAPIAVLSGLDSKGLEFDHVIVVEPARVVAPDRSGLRLLYVMLTRATRRLVVVHSEPLPEALGLAPRNLGA